MKFFIQGTTARVVEDIEFQSINVENFFKEITGKLDVKKALFYKSCSNCRKRLNEDNSCRYILEFILLCTCKN